MNIEEPYLIVGQRIRQVREHQGLRQDDLASKVSLTRTSITNIERGKQRLLLHTLCEIALALGVEPSSLLPTLSELMSVRDVKSLDENLSQDELDWMRSMIGSPEKE